ncbi:MAG: hypothetical protein SFV32_04770 [Opitutaceae bacterium]|nr:hypothetical protein [Opitutaceae bacterium]
MHESTLGALQIGYNTFTNRDQAIAIGSNSRASASRSVAMGIGAETGDATGTLSTGAVAFGYLAKAVGEEAASFGSRSSALGTAALAIGNGTRAGANGSTAIGVQSSSDGPWSVAFGTHSYAGGYSASAFGYGVQAYGDSSAAVGAYAYADGPFSFAIGVGPMASGLNTYALGNGCQNTVANTVMIEHQALDGEGFFVGYGNILLAPTGGAVGIGTSTPDAAYKLSVNGKIRAEEIVVETGWADYVFKSDYKLRTLSEVDSFIQLNGHLPDVPSAAEVQANGIALADFQRVLLQKIEEMTLHQIAMEKRIQALEAENLSLRNR